MKGEWDNLTGGGVFDVAIEVVVLHILSLQRSRLYISSSYHWFSLLLIILSNHSTVVGPLQRQDGPCSCLIEVTEAFGQWAQQGPWWERPSVWSVPRSPHQLPRTKRLITPAEISIGTSYKEQTTQYHHAMDKAKDEDYNGVRIVAIDSMQGDPNKSVNMILVYSVHHLGRLGFILSSNRVNIDWSRPEDKFHMTRDPWSLTKTGARPMRIQTDTDADFQEDKAEMAEFPTTLVINKLAIINKDEPKARGDSLRSKMTRLSDSTE